MAWTPTYTEVGQDVADASWAAFPRNKPRSLPSKRLFKSFARAVWPYVRCMAGRIPDADVAREELPTC